MLRVALSKIPSRAVVQYILAEKTASGLKPAELNNFDNGESPGVFVNVETSHGAKMARVSGFRKVVYKNLAGKINIPENLKDIVDGLSSGMIQSTVDGKKKDFIYSEMDDQLKQLPLTQLSSIVVAFDVVEVEKNSVQAINLRTSLDISAPKNINRQRRR